jgi:hypothetical protein
LDKKKIKLRKLKEANFRGTGGGGYASNESTTAFKQELDRVQKLCEEFSIEM